MSCQSEQCIAPKHLGRPHEQDRVSHESRDCGSGRKPEVLEKTVAVSVEVLVVLIVIVAADS